MPLSDHFSSPLDDAVPWEELHGQWPAVIVQDLRKRLPPGFVAGPHVHSGAQVEFDVAECETTLPDFDEYEVRIYDSRRGRHLVAAIEIVSPAKKDRPDHRNVFVAKCAALLQKGVAVSIIDLVTVRQFNLYADLLEFIGHDDPTIGVNPPNTYAASSRWTRKDPRTLFEAWSHVLALGQPLPTLPLCLNEELVVPLDLEQSYERACNDLWIA